MKWILNIYLIQYVQNMSTSVVEWWKKIEIFYVLFLVLSLWSLVCILQLQHISIWTSHILNGHKPHVATGYCDVRCSSGGRQKDIVSSGSLDESMGHHYPAGPGVLETLGKQLLSHWISGHCVITAYPISIINVHWTSQKDPGAFQLWSNPSKNGQLHEFTLTPMKSPPKKVAPVWKVAIATLSALGKSSQNKPIQGEYGVPQSVSCSSPTL